MIQVVPPLPLTERGFPCNIVSVNSEITVYGAGATVVIRSGLVDCNLINYHQTRVTAVSISPSGAWIASGDNRGNVKIWVSRGEYLLKYEYKLLSSTVRSLAWSADSKRLAVGGGEQSKAGEAVCVAFDTGARLGEIVGHSKCITCIAFRPKAPFRIMSGGEDSRVIFHDGPPFKFLKSQQSVHSSFVNSVAFSTDGVFAFSCASDGLVAMYQGDSGDIVSVLDPKLPCSIWGLTPSAPDLLLIACGDKKLRSVALTPCLRIEGEVVVGNGTLNDMPLGIAGFGPRIVTVSLDGVLRTWSGTSCNTATWCGSQGAITAIVKSLKSNCYYVSSAEGSVWSLLEDKTTALSPPKPIKGSAGLLIDHNETLWAVSAHNDSQLISVFHGCDEISAGQSITALIPCDGSSLIGIGEATKGKAIVDIPSGTVVMHTDPCCVSAISRDGSVRAFVYEKAHRGLAIEKRVVEVVRNGTETFIVETEVTAADIVCVAVEADLLAVASGNHELHVYQFEDGTYRPNIFTIRCWTYHKARISCLRWIDRFLVSAGLDKQVIVWDFRNPTDGPVAQLRDLHREGISALCVTKQSPNALSIVTGGSEGSVRVNTVLI